MNAARPVAFSVAMAGEMVVFSSLPKAPFSPAWGLSPQTAMRRAYERMLGDAS